MFHHVVFYKLRYQWVKGEQVQTFSPPGLSGRPKYRIRDRSWRRTVFGLGFVRSMTESYLEWLWENHKPKDATGVRCILTYRENDESKKTHERMTYPPHGGDR